MPRVKVLVTREISKAGIDVLKKTCEVKVSQLGRSLTKEELIEEVKDIDGLLPYKVMKQFQTAEGVQTHRSLFTLRHPFRAFPRGRRKGFSPVQLEGVNVSLND